MEKRIIGMNLQMEYAQFCWYDTQEKQPVCVTDSDTQTCTRFENELFFLTEDKSWHCGAEAQELYMSRPGQYFTDILKQIGEKSVMIVDGREYDYVDLFCILVQLQLEQCFGAEGASFSRLVIASPLANASLYRAVQQLLRVTKRKPGQIELISSDIAMLFYLSAQESGIWSNGVALFHYGAQGMELERVLVQRYERPMKLTVTWESVPDMVPLSADAQQKDLAFQKICRTTFAGRRHNASGVYLLGEGFDGNWLNASANALCQGRRVFVGQNLSVQGACYAAAEDSAVIGADGSIYVNAPGMIHYDIGVKVWYQGKEQIAPIALGEREWFCIEGSASIFLDDTDRIEIVLYHRTTRELIREVIEIKGLPKRPPKTTKLQISVRYLDADRGQICIRDQGFGSMYPTTGKVYRKEFVLPQERTEK